VAGFDNIQYGLYTSPPLTTVDLQSEHMGAAAMAQLIATVEGKEPPPATMIEPQLIVRGSTPARHARAGGNDGVIR
jgi:LacI family transcriptional regulator